MRCCDLAERRRRPAGSGAKFTFFTDLSDCTASLLHPLEPHPPFRLPQVISAPFFSALCAIIA
ncbi:hypothetical protein U9M48_006785 [Paspalum notatum var. saurae]|uniref:Uncharacterized protein n=1 Tax=Paspalum notatum var. saurae TaxID=547442 RepID=A0AAQ3PQ95_PASNO